MSRRKATSKNTSAEAPAPMTLLMVDDDHFWLEHTAKDIELALDWKTLRASTPEAALQILSNLETEVSAVVVDVMMRPDGRLTAAETHDGHLTGIVLTRYIRQLRPRIPIIGTSNISDFAQWFFRQDRMSFIPKPINHITLLEQVHHLRRDTLIGLQSPKSLIVHGHDPDAVSRLSDIVVHDLGWQHPLVLQALPGRGRTIIEKLEEAAESAQVVFVLLTPDDAGRDAQRDAREELRARQNVIFELGFFFGKFHRRSGRIVLLYKRPVELPSDLDGITYIDITQGLASASEGIRTELRGLVGSSPSPSPSGGTDAQASAAAGSSPADYHPLSGRRFAPGHQADAADVRPHEQARAPARR